MKTTLLALVAGALVATGSAHAATIAPNDPLNVGLLPNGAQFQLIFVTQNALQRDLLDGSDDGSDDALLADWDAWVQSQANASTMPGVAALTWSAVVGWDDSRDQLPGIGAKDHAVVSAGVLRLDGGFVASGFADMWDGSIASPININENGVPATGGKSEVWSGDVSGYASTGAVGPWGAGDGVNGMQTGFMDAIGGTWHDFGAHFRRGPNDARRAYALSEVITVGVPEPASLALLGFGGLMIARRRG